MRNKKIRLEIEEDKLAGLIDKCNYCSVPDTPFSNGCDYCQNHNLFQPSDKIWKDLLKELGAEFISKDRQRE